LGVDLLIAVCLLVNDFVMLSLDMAQLKSVVKINSRDLQYKQILPARPFAMCVLVMCCEHVLASLGCSLNE